MNNKRITIIIIAAILVSILSACFGKESQNMHVGNNAQAGDLDLSPCMVKLNSGKYDAECSIVVYKSISRS